MSLRDYIENKIEQENSRLRNNHLFFKTPTSAGEIVDLYRTYNGLKRQMRALSDEQVEEYLQRGYAFAGAYYDKELAGIVVSKKLPENYPYFALPKNENKGDVFTLGGLYVKKGFEGMGIASKLSKIITNGTQEYSKNTGDGVGMGYEVSYDNFGSLRILSNHGSYIGYYADEMGKEGLSILLYKPFTHEEVKIEKPEIELSSNEEFSQNSLSNAALFIARQEGIDGLTTTTQQVEEDNFVNLTVLNNTPNTLPTSTFQIVEQEQ